MNPNMVTLYQVGFSASSSLLTIGRAGASDFGLRLEDDSGMPEV
jgi:hypothetical protein